ncbi:tRNA dihydrouridine(20/20a) synthase DusA [Sedimenticola hydrogenitrophicus]|uniref:tRNA dihydrouridine(20/20a) synthase DusA n=1 Tax=Sedimenticola hydrogenitrophicus TaxID=2967975 RepID=UPI0023AF14BA|nr:tRNA dihydrouridine(20/20a) synthase DusA [Sedimenticola hydrogenitrophicus]
MIDRRLCIAPMLDWTDRYCRYFLRLITRHALLYTEMVTTGALLHGNQPRHLDFDPAEHPVALQLGGSDPHELAACARLAEHWGYDEVNLNVGCPSDRVQSGRFGACLMATPGVVADGVAAMRAATSLPVTVKHRIGIDELDSYELLVDFVATVAEAGCETFIIHARKAWLNGLSPKENREIPPLRYDVVHRIKHDFPHLEIIINGGIAGLDQAAAQLQQVDGVMIGREAYQNPWILAEADRRLYGDDHPVPSRHEIIERLMPFAEQVHAEGAPVNRISRHILGLFQGQPRARAWRRHISENAHRDGATPEVIREAARRVPAC